MTRPPLGGHTCHALGCKAEVPPRMFMCYRHWSLIPKAKQRELWRVYREGQEIDKSPSREYLDVARALRVYVADAEGVPVPPLLRRLANGESAAQAIADLVGDPTE